MDNQQNYKPPAFLALAGVLVVLLLGSLGVFTINQQQNIAAPVVARQPPSPKDTAFSLNLSITRLSQELETLPADIQTQASARRDLEMKLKSAIAERKQKMVKLLIEDKNPRAFLEAVLPGSVRDQLSTELKSDVEARTKVSGELEVLIIDRLSDTNKSFSAGETNYFLRIDRSKNKNKKKLYLTEPLSLISGSKLSVDGYVLGDYVVAANTPQTIEPTYIATPVSDSLGEQKTLIFLIDFLDSGPRPFTPTEAQDLIFNGQFNAFMREQSYGKTWFTGDVTEWITLQRNNTFNSPCHPSMDIGNNPEITDYISRRNIDLSYYDHAVILVHHPLTMGGCSSLGKTNLVLGEQIYRLSLVNVGLPGATEPYSVDFLVQIPPFSWTNLDAGMAHELGHALGLRHANGWDCGSSVLYGDCRHVEYGNYFDAMGVYYYSLHFNSFYKELLGWFDDQNTLSIRQSGTYELGPLEAGEGHVAARVSGLNLLSSPYYLEWRQAIGFDAGLSREGLSTNRSGLLINKVSERNTNNITSYILDTQATSLLWAQDLASGTSLYGSRSFSDPDAGVTISQVWVDDNGGKIRFSIVLDDPQCVRQDPVISLDTLSVPTGTENASLLVTIENRDSPVCGISSFSTSLVLPDGWSLIEEYPSGDIGVSPDGPSVQKRFDVYIPAGTPSGNYELRLEVSNLDSGYHVYLTSNLRVSSAALDLRANDYDDRIILIGRGQPLTLSWSTSNAIACWARDSWSGQLPASGSLETRSAHAPGYYYYRMTCGFPPVDSGGAPFSLSASVLAIVTDLVDLRVNNSDGPVYINPGDSVVLSWNSHSAASSCRFTRPAIDGWSIDQPNNGSLLADVTIYGEYTITCELDHSNRSWPISDSIFIDVDPLPAPAPTVNLKANGGDGPVSISRGTAATLSWESANANSCLASNRWSGERPTSGSVVLTLAQTGTHLFSLTCTGSGGSALDSVIVNVVELTKPGGKLKRQ